MNVTVWPTAAFTPLALTPAAVMVIVAPLPPAVPPSRTTTVTPPLGELGDEPPQAASVPSAMREPMKRT